MKPLDLIWVDTDKSVDPACKKIRSRLCAREYKTKKQSKIHRALPASQLFSAMPPLEAVKVLVSIMMSVSVSNKGKPLKLRHHDISRAHFQRTAQGLIYIRLPAEDRQKCGEDKVGRLVKSTYGTLRRFPHLATRLCESGMWRVGRLPKRQTQCSIVPQSKSRCEGGSARRRLCLFVGR